MRRPPRVFTIWFTGIPASGKTTLASGLCDRLRRGGRRADVIDGDRLRSGWCAGLGFSRKDRTRNILRAATLARLLNEAGIIACVALVSPLRRARARARRKIPVFIEAHVDCPVSVCRRRDPKGLYRRAAGGALRNLTGAAGGYERPVRPEITVNTSRLSLPACLRKISKELKKRGLA